MVSMIDGAIAYNDTREFNIDRERLCHANFDGDNKERGRERERERERDSKIHIDILIFRSPFSLYA